MVDVSEKSETKRRAIARGFVRMQSATLELILSNGLAKGNVFATARIAGIMAAKMTSQIIPLCHPLPVANVMVEFNLAEDHSGIEIITTASAIARTGVEMEALTAVAASALTIYDMCKAVDKEMVIEDILLVKKTGGKSDRKWETD